MTELETRFRLQTFDSDRAGRLGLVTLDNGGGPTRPPTLDRVALDSLDRVLGEVESAGLRGLLVTGPPMTFCAGADVHAFEDMDARLAREAAQRGHAVFGRLRALEMPKVAAIGGVCMGGGLELALHCDVRTVSRAAPALAFPEVSLSIVPGWGGTQLATRVAGPGAALQLIVHNALDENRTVAADEAAALGIVDHVLDPVDFVDASLRILERLVTGESEPPPRHAAGPRADAELEAALERARAHAERKVHGATVAPTRAIELIEHAGRGGLLEDGLAREEDALTELLPSPQAKASVYAFDLVQTRVKRQLGRPDVAPRPLDRLAIIGAGTMGAQLAAYFLTRLERPIVLQDVDDSVLETARGTVEAAVDAGIEKGKLPARRRDFLKSLLTCTTDVAGLAGSDLVLEAAPEMPDLKRRLFATAERYVDAECIFATNTSSLSIGRMAEALEHPERVVGLHFFNPVEVLPLVEIGCTDVVDDSVVASAFTLCGDLHKRGVRCADAPAFVVNRLLLRLMVPCLAATRLGTPFRVVDRAVEALGVPMGPFALLELVGPAIAWHTLESLHDAFPDRFPLDENLERLAGSGRRRIYAEGARRSGEVDEEVARAWTVDADATPLGEVEVRQRALEAVADEAHRLIDDHVVHDARDVDTCLILGAGWPLFNGGICKLLDQTGTSQKLFGEPLVSRVDRTALAWAPEE